MKEVVSTAVCGPELSFNSLTSHDSFPALCFLPNYVVEEWYCVSSWCTWYCVSSWCTFVRSFPRTRVLNLL